MQRIVVKIGSQLLTRENGWLNIEFLEKLVKEIKRLHTNKKEVILITSGAVAAGREELKQKIHPGETLHEKQALAAIGQSSLMRKYHHIFTKENDIHVAQILLQLHDFENLDTVQNTHNVLKLLLRRGVLPVVNENEVTSMDEIKALSKDRLAAKIANLVGADAIVLLSDVAGLFDANPHTNPKAKLISEIQKSDLKKFRPKDAKDQEVKDKIEAAKIAEAPIWIADGNLKGVLTQIVLQEENPGTLIA
ncbi:MAG: glutamate 5-kinase [Candidatus Gracilibacteria bacterium]|nr:glutamate 5-kinase [Candidatus Gracilibacteria bacterium]MDD5179465.1 glutamate 5-kinase [Candidatus Gracilibacteria bacterium]